MGIVGPLTFARAAAQNDVDPARTWARQALRVLLGRGDAIAVSRQSFSFEGKLYRGSFERTEDGEIVNLIELESYLYSVVPREMPAGWPPAALQAQSICARTYVLQRSDPRRSYDLVPSELDQVYEGMMGETASGNSAVDATAQEVLAFAGGFAQIAYSSCCGGHTESSSEAWGSAPISYLTGVVCTSCDESPNYRWNRALALDAIESRLAIELTGFGRLENVQIGSRDASGRARTLELLTDTGSTTLSGGAFRRGLGTRVLPSLLLSSVQRAGDNASVSISGAGLGHGVGLCQWGARGMAIAGRTASDILASYFPGTDLRHLT